MYRFLVTASILVLLGLIYANEGTGYRKVLLYLGARIEITAVDIDCNS